ncbi:MAG: relaxase MobL [Acetatifactor sp.]|nr:relaxase MobL [Acetatifactor sp.]
MAGLIVRCNYVKGNKNHGRNFVRYLGTREGAVMNPDNVRKAFFEDNDPKGWKSNYVDYVANRPGVEKEGMEHGLFSDADAPIDLEAVMEEVAAHDGPVWTNVLSLKREDAERLGYDELDRWKTLIRSHAADLAESFQIAPDNLRWYAAFHDEGHHPHVHLMVYSAGKDGYLSRKGIEKLKSEFANDVFRNEMTCVYEVKSRQRKAVKEAAEKSLRDALDRLKQGISDSPELAVKTAILGRRLSGLKGRKVYGYLNGNVKDEVDEIVRMIEKDPAVREAYEKWIDYQNQVHGFYGGEPKKALPLSRNPEFRSIKNDVIREAIRIHEGGAINAMMNAMREAKGMRISGQTQGAEEAIARAHAVEQKASQDLFRLCVNLGRRLEQLFSSRARSQGGKTKYVREKKEMEKEMERKAALGIKTEFIDESEDEKQNSQGMGLFM